MQPVRVLVLLAALFLVSCAAAPERPAETQSVRLAEVRGCCLHRCANVRRIGRCSEADRSKPTTTFADLVASPERYQDRRLRLRGKLQKQEGDSWTLLGCDCCNYQPGARLTVADEASSASLGFAGTARLADGTRQPLECHRYPGYMIETFAARRTGRPEFRVDVDVPAAKVDDGVRVEPALCCSIDAHAQPVVVEATLRIEVLSDDSSEALLEDPFICEL